MALFATANSPMSPLKPKPIDPERVQQVMRYAVAVAANADDFQHRELGPIHLLKYAYLADLAYAEKHGGESYTGIPWQFHHFGPWAQEAHQQIPVAMTHRAIRHRSFRGDYQDDVSRWSSHDPELEDALEPALPHVVSRAVKRAVKGFGNDTSGLLHHVYRTAPMLRAAPHESLDLSAAAQDAEPEGPPQVEKVEERLSRSERKRRQEALDKLKSRAREALKRRRMKREQNKTKPTYTPDELLEVVEWVDSLAGDPVEPLEGELIVSDDIWKSPARSGH